MDQLDKWLRHNKFDKYVELFRMHEVEIDDLSNLTEKDGKISAFRLGREDFFLTAISQSISSGYIPKHDSIVGRQNENSDNGT